MPIIKFLNYKLLKKFISDYPIRYDFLQTHCIIILLYLTAITWGGMEYTQWKYCQKNRKEIKAEVVWRNYNNYHHIKQNSDRNYHFFNLSLLKPKTKQVLSSGRYNWLQMQMCSLEEECKIFDQNMFSSKSVRLCRKAKTIVLTSLLMGIDYF